MDYYGLEILYANLPKVRILDRLLKGPLLRAGSILRLGGVKRARRAKEGLAVLLRLCDALWTMSVVELALQLEARAVLRTRMAVEQLDRHLITQAVRRRPKVQSA